MFFNYIEFYNIFYADLYMNMINVENEEKKFKNNTTPIY